MPAPFGPDGLPGGMPPMGPPGGTGPVSVPAAMPGAQAQGTDLVKTALEMLQKALPTIPLGGELHGAVIKAVADLSKHVGKIAGNSDPQAVVQQLAKLAMAARQQQMPPGLGPPGGPPGPQMGAGGPPGGMPPGLGG